MDKNHSLVPGWDSDLGKDHPCYTPPPWGEVKPVTSCFGVYGIEAIHRSIKTDWENGGSQWRKEHEANARLITAAPELLHSLKTVLECWELGLQPSESQSDYDAAKALIERVAGQ